MWLAGVFLSRSVFDTGVMLVEGSPDVRLFFRHPALYIVIPVHIRVMLDRVPVRDRKGFNTGDSFQ